MFAASQEPAIGWLTPPPPWMETGGVPLTGGGSRLTNEIANHEDHDHGDMLDMLGGAAGGGGLRFRAYFPSSSTTSTTRHLPPTTPSPLATTSDNRGHPYHRRYTYQRQRRFNASPELPVPESSSPYAFMSTAPTSTPLLSPPQLISPAISVPEGMDRDTSEHAHTYAQSHCIHLAEPMELVSSHNFYSGPECACGETPARAAGGGGAAQGVTSGGSTVQRSSPIASIWNNSGTSSSWNDTHLHSPPLFGSSSSDHLSSSVDSDFGGAPITPQDIRITNRGKERFAGCIYEGFETDTEDDDSDGGIGFDIEMDSTTQVLFPSSTMAMDEDEGFSPDNLVTRPPSPVSGGLLGIIPLLSPNTGEDTSAEEVSDSPMQLDSPVRTLPSALTSAHQPHLTPIAQSSLDHHPLFHDSSSEAVAATAEEEESQEMYMPDSVEDGRSMASQDSLLEHPTPAVSPSPSPSTPATTVPDELEDDSIPSFGAADEFIVNALHFFTTPSSGEGTSFLENHPSLSAFPEFPDYSEYLMASPALFTDLFMPPTHPLTTTMIHSVTVDDDEDDVAPRSNDVVFDNEVVTQEMERYNSDFASFCGQLWNRQVVPSIRERYNSNNPPPHISIEGRKIAEWAKTRPAEITEEDVEERGEDIQGIQWEKLELNKKHARRWRQSRYLNYRNITKFTKESLPAIRSNQEFYTFRRHNSLRCRLMHFQLRNVLALTDRNNIFFSTGDQVLSYHPITHTLRDPLLDLSEDVLADPIRISTLGGCGGSNAVVMAGGFNGTFALKPLHANLSDPPITGTLTRDENGITNHIQLIRSRHTNTPHAVTSSNDKFIRTIDTSSPRNFISQHPFNWAVNCSATSPDSRLRAVVGDTTEVLIVDAERGRTEFVLQGHQDYGFAAAWSSDGFTLATGNQDQTVRIFDARNFSNALKIFPMRMAGCRTLRFAPGRGGVLAMAEPADLVHIVETRRWEGMQTLQFWGEVGGMEFSPDAEELVVANTDRFVGGLMTWRKRRGGWMEEEEGEFEVPRGGGIELGNEYKGRRFGGLETGLGRVFV
ncbi:hypothetical protein K440DRAFT_655338 [Wilcoxina mikolae CBS 423.85]|nr:hypothetical protein K440DRAFT_655338 [Wilcoxina mikolae CBS 423.85]